MRYFSFYFFAFAKIRDNKVNTLNDAPTKSALLSNNPFAFSKTKPAAD
jgi:hypothetical protein